MLIMYVYLSVVWLDVDQERTPERDVFKND